MPRVLALITHSLITFFAIGFTMGIYLKVSGQIEWNQFAVWSAITIGLASVLGVLSWLGSLKKR